AAAPVQAGSSLPATLGGLSLSVRNGSSSVLAPLLYVSPTQINFQVPDLTPGQEAQLWIQRGAAESSLVGSTQVEDGAPGLFMADPAWATPVFTTVDSGWELVSFYGTGFPTTAGSRIECTIAGFPATIEHTASLGPGIERLDVRMPAAVLNLIGDEGIAYA